MKPNRIIMSAAALALLFSICAELIFAQPTPDNTTPPETSPKPTVTQPEDSPTPPTAKSTTENTDPTKPVTKDAENIKADVFMIDIIGPIHKGSAERIIKQIQFAEENGAKTIVFNMDTPGGAVTSAENIIKAIHETSARTISWVNPDGISAGAMISVSCDEIIVAKRSRLGDCAPIMIGPDGSLKQLQDTERSKAESPILTTFRAAAQEHNYPLSLSIAMVKLGQPICKIKNAQTNEVQYVYQNMLPQYGIQVDPNGNPLVGSAAKDVDPDNNTDWDFIKFVVREKELLTMTTDEAIEYGFAKAVINSEEELTTYTNTQLPIAHLKATQLEELAAWLNNPSIRGVLMMAFLIAGYMEMQAPGLGVPGAVAACALILFLGAPYLTGFASLLEIFFILLGILLIIVEIFIIPGFGVAGISGMILILLGFLFTFAPPEPGPHWIPQLDYTWDRFQAGIYSMTISFAISIVAFILLTKYFGAIPAFNKLVLKDGNYVKSETPSGAEYQPGSISPGMEGKSITPLRPVGRAEFDNQILDVVTSGGIVEAHQPIKIIEVQGNRIVVEQIT